MITAKEATRLANKANEKIPKLLNESLKKISNMVEILAAGGERKISFSFSSSEIGLSYYQEEVMSLLVFELSRRFTLLGFKNIITAVSKENGGVPNIHVEMGWD